MLCVEEKCGGEVDVSYYMVLLKTSCGPPTTPAFVCKKCGRLHWRDGEGVENRRDEKAFFINGTLFHDDGKGGKVAI